MSRSFAVALASMGAFLLANTASAHKVALDAGLYTLYSGPADGSHIDFDVCGQLVGSGGCYGGGILDNFESACSVLEGRPKTNENVVTRAIYILDRHLTKRASATLYVYTRTDTITDTLDQVQVTLTTQVAVGITAGQNAKCMMAANDRFLYIGTNKDPVAVSVDKKSFGLVSIQQYEPTASITADDRGYVTVSSQGNYTFDPDGVMVGEGGGAYYMANTRNAQRPIIKTCRSVQNRYSTLLSAAQCESRFHPVPAAECESRIQHYRANRCTSAPKTRDGLARAA